MLRGLKKGRGFSHLSVPRDAKESVSFQSLLALQGQTCPCGKLVGRHEEGFAGFGDSVESSNF